MICWVTFKDQRHMPTQNPKYRNRVVRFFRFGLDHLHFAIVQANLDLRNERKHSLNRENLPNRDFYLLIVRKTNLVNLVNLRRWTFLKSRFSCIEPLRIVKSRNIVIINDRNWTYRQTFFLFCWIISAWILLRLE